MANSVLKDRHGPDWPLGAIVVATPGTPVGIMSLVDPTGVNDPAAPTPGTAGADEYTPRCNQIVFQGFKTNTNGMQVNTGNVYIVRYAARGAGAGNRNDTGTMVGIIPSGGSFILAAAPLNRDVFSPYRYYIDADNAGDSALVTLIIQ